MKWIKRHKGVMVAVVVVVMLAVCGFIFIPKLLKGSGGRGQVRRQTNTVSLEKMDLTESVSATGTIESAKVKTVSASVSDVKVKKVKVSVGDTVKKGQTLAVFDKSDLKSSLTQAIQDLADAKSQAATDLSSAKVQLSNAYTTYATDKKTLKAEVKAAKKALKKLQNAAKKKSKKSSQASTKSFNSSSLLSSVVSKQSNEIPTGSRGGTSQGMVSQTSEGTSSAVTTSATGSVSTQTSTPTTVSGAKAALKQAKQNLKSTNRTNLQSIQSAKENLKSVKNTNTKSVRQAKQSVQDVKKALKSCSAKATMSGTITALGIEAGDTYSGGDIAQISDVDHFQISTSVSEYDINSVKKGQKVVILTDATGDTQINGKITYVAVTMGTTSLSSGSSMTSSMGGDGGSNTSTSSSDGYEVRIKVSDKNKSLRIGMTAKCSIIISEASDVYAVPYDAIHTTDDSSVIYVSDSSGGQREVSVKKGMESDYYVEVTGSELTEGMSVIIPSDTTSDSSSDSSSSDKDSSDTKDSFGFMSGGDRGGPGERGGGNGGPPGM